MIIRLTILCASLLMLATAASTPSFAQGPAQAAPQTDTAELPKRVAVRFLTDSDHPPFNYYDEEGVLTGFNIDMARAICLEMTAACDIQVRPWAELGSALAKRETDAVIASHVLSPALLRIFDFTDRYFYTPAWFAGRRGGPRLAPTPEGLEGLKIAVVRGGAHEAYLRTFFKDSAIVPYESTELARDALVASQVNLLFDDGIGLVLWLNGTLSRECCEMKAGPFYEPKFFGDGIAIMVSKQDPQLKGLINQALARVRASGRYEELLLRYFPNRLF
ncbi:MAG: transporter substrate-binding domain-containing protein [Hyphomicrobiaceae bacterium]